MATLDSVMGTAYDTAASALYNDLRFEHLEDDDALWAFASCCISEPTTDHVPGFILDNAHTVDEATCYFAIEHLYVDQDANIGIVRFLPSTSPEIPTESWMSLGDNAHGVAAVTVRGTDFDRMVERARTEIDHALRIFRVALHEVKGVHTSQLRFRIGDYHILEDRQSGRRLRDDAASALPLHPSLLDVTTPQPIFSLTSTARTDVEQKAHIALRWAERADLEVDLPTSVLFRFFALEALLSRKSERRKEYALAYRVMMLSHLTMRGFSNPDRIVTLYDVVRSASVHGEQPAEIDRFISEHVRGQLTDTLNGYLQLAAQVHLRRRSRLLDHLDQHPDRRDLATWLRINSRFDWSSALPASTANEPDPRISPEVT